MSVAKHSKAPEARRAATREGPQSPAILAGWRPALLIALALVPGLALALVLGADATPQAVGGTLGSWLLAEVHAGQTLSQSFVVRQDRLIGVRLPLFTSGLRREHGDEPVIVRLRSSLRPGPDLAVAQMALRELNPKGPTDFFFDGFAFSPTFPARVVSTTLYLVVEAPTLEAGSGLMIAGTSGNYHEGVLRVAGKRLTRYDLAFTPIYGPLLGDGLLPLSRLAHDKPGVLGWPPLYVLLLYTFALGFALAAGLLLRRSL
jgi:hypothetical protein